jgi:1-acyl-sn-glycerol-3-phosphate acyltransferase
MADFRPPIENPAFMALCHWGLPLELWRSRTEVRVVENGLERLQQLRGKRAVIVSNHSDQFDPEVVFTLSKMMQEYVYFIAARECFDWVHGAVGWFFQNLGCYSVARGEADKESFEMTREILKHGKRKLVMFPEGEVTRQPDVVLPLRKGAVRLFLEAQDELDREKAGEEIIVQPIGIRWRYRDDIMPKLHAALRKIENELRILPPSQRIVDRIEFASMTMAAILEQEYGADQRDDLPFERRIITLREHVLRTMALSLSVELPEDEDHLGWFRRINAALNQFVRADMSEASDFQKRLHKELAGKADRVRNDLIRMQHLIGITEDEEFRQLTPERLANKVAKIEREVLGKVSYKGIRVAMIGVADPIRLRQYLQEFRADSDNAIEKATERVHDALQSTVDKLDTIQRTGYAASLPR